MKMRFIQGLNLIGLVLLAAVGCSKNSTVHSEGPFTEAQATALNSMGVLREMRAGRITNALEFLERQIDDTVRTIDSEKADLSGTQQENALEVLRALKAYREDYPRHQEATLAGDQTPNAWHRENMEAVSNIMARVE